MVLWNGADEYIQGSKGVGIIRYDSLPWMTEKNEFCLFVVACQWLMIVAYLYTNVLR